MMMLLLLMEGRLLMVLLLRRLLSVRGGSWSRRIRGNGRRRREDLRLGLVLLRSRLGRWRIPGEMGDAQGGEFFLPALRGDLVST